MTSTPRSRLASMRASCALAALGLLVLAPAHAKTTDRDQPMNVDASHFDGFQKPNSVSTLTGNVVITLVPGTDVSHSYSSLAESPTLVMSDEQSGTFDGNLRPGLETSGPAIHVQGTFHC